MDGLGHGLEASHASSMAAAVFEEYAHETLVTMVQRCHEALIKSRGIALGIASFDARQNRMRWLGVGNVAGVLIRGDLQAKPPAEALLMKGGVVGYRLPQLRISELGVRNGDILVFATDGIESRFTGHLSPTQDLQTLADGILSRFGKATDDALILAARYVEGSTHSRE